MHEVNTRVLCFSNVMLNWRRGRKVGRGRVVRKEGKKEGIKEEEEEKGGSRKESGR